MVIFRIRSLSLTEDPSLTSPLALRGAQDDNGCGLFLCLVLHIIHFSYNKAVILSIPEQSEGISEGSFAAIETKPPVIRQGNSIRLEVKIIGKTISSDQRI